MRAGPAGVAVVADTVPVCVSMGAGPAIAAAVADAVPIGVSMAAGTAGGPVVESILDAAAHALADPAAMVGRCAQGENADGEKSKYDSN